MFDETNHCSLLKAQEENLSLRQRDLAKRLGVGFGKINYCLRTLVKRFSLMANNFRSDNNRLVCGYLLTSYGVGKNARITIRFLKNIFQESEGLRGKIENLPLRSGTTRFAKNVYE